MHDQDAPGVSIDDQVAPGRLLDPEALGRVVELYLRDPEAACYLDARPLGGLARTPLLLLVTRGHRSGRLFTRPLVYVQDGGRYIVVGSRGGGEQPPSWIINVQADPQVEVQVVRERFQALAVFVHGAERERLWEELVRMYPPYRSFQERSAREIPVVALTRRAQAGG
jgi:deazaflavin-dependent oxidoreductase (nitroreductase family)